MKKENSPERDESVDDRVTGYLTFRLIVLRRSSSKRVIDPVTDSASDTEENENDEIDQNVEIGLLLDFRTFRRCFTWRIGAFDQSESGPSRDERKKNYLG